MARKLHNDVEIDDFIAKVIGEALHHAPEVSQIIQPLSDAVRARLRLTRDDVSVYERNGNLARTCWVTRAGRRYVFTYNYTTKQIDLRSGTLRGTLVASFDNATSQPLLGQIVSGL